MATTTAKIGVVGLGHMGGNMAARFLAAGYTVYGESRDRGDEDDLLHEGLEWRDTPREVAKAADVLIKSVPNDDVLESVASGSDGILAGLTESKVWIDMSTVSPRASREVAKRVRDQGAAMLDAPVSGSVPQANRNADDHGRRRRAGVREGRADPARARHADAHRRERAGAGAQACDQHQPRREDAGFRRGPRLGRAVRDRPQARGRGDDQEPDRLADAEGTRRPCPRLAGRGLVRCQPDAEGRRARARHRTRAPHPLAVCRNGRSAAHAGERARLRAPRPRGALRVTRALDERLAADVSRSKRQAARPRSARC